MKKIISFCAAVVLLFGLSGNAALPVSATTPPYTIFHYDTVDGLIGGLASGLRAGMHFTEEEARHFPVFAENLKDGTVPLYVPYHQGEEIPFSNREGWYNIEICSSYLYSRPWISYYPDRQTNIIAIDIMYLDEELKAEAQEKPGSWLRKQLAPNSPNVDNYRDFASISLVSDVRMPFAGRTVNALTVHYRGDPKTDTFFVYDDVLVYIVSLG